VNNPVSDVPLTDERLYAALQPRKFHFQAVVDSTNNIARGWALANAPSGAVVVTEEQTAGRGRLGRSWHAPAGSGLLFSTILRPNIVPERIARVTMIGAVAVAEILEQHAPGLVALKWSNDVKLRGRKVCGILAESVWYGDSLAAVILGIGINIAIDFTGSELQDTAISLSTVTGTVPDRAAMLANLLKRIDYWTARIDGSELFGAWRSRLETIGQQVVRSGISGLALDVDSEGALLIRDERGTMHRVIAGEIG
jgi:BirA family transcriptional regulator, biotin operon repressor / biotin---[acetyl-CoA-carboxylase] ligase